MGDASGFAQVGLPKFDGDYDHWSLLMENLLRCKEYWGVVSDGIQEPAIGAQLSAVESKCLDDLRLKDLKAKNYLFSSIDKSILKTITNKGTAKQLWDAMKTKYQGSARVQKAQLQALRRNFEVLKMKEGETVTSYFSRVMVVANDMRNCGEEMPDVKIVEKILRTLTERFNYVVCSIEESKDIETLSVDALYSSLLVHEQKFHTKPLMEEDRALKTFHEYGGRGGRGAGRGSYPGRGRGRGGRGWNRENVECFKCHKLGHYRSECPDWYTNQQAYYSSSSHQNQNRMSDDVLLMAFLEETQVVGMEHLWFLDSGCSNHMSGDRKWFAELDTSSPAPGKVGLGNDSRLDVAGKGIVRLQINGVSLVVHDVFFVPGLKTNLLSMGQLQENGLEFLVRRNECKIFHEDKGFLLETRMQASRMFVLQATSTKKVISANLQCLQAEKAKESSLSLWHRRFGHFNPQGLLQVQRKQWVQGMPELKGEVGVCSTCQVGKQTRQLFPQKSS
ncbi:unnamed protein product [Linum trigynum]|uniref:CCHC-type domain-containing protein n=1 Tax=Linum trigynum TaxID=586398 RepID=A0AAV2DEF0_9ROSI